MCDGSCSDIGGSHYPYECNECEEKREHDEAIQANQESLERIERIEKDLKLIMAHLGIEDTE